MGASTGTGIREEGPVAEGGTYGPEVDARFPGSRLPLLVYKAGAVHTPCGARDPEVAAAAFEALFASNGWSVAWRDGVFPYPHYHSTAHEALGCFVGWATVRFGEARTLRICAGDAVVIPAGVAHACESQSPDFCVVGAYPPGQVVDLLVGTDGERPASDARIAALALPATDPVLGAIPTCVGVLACWHAARSAGAGGGPSDST